MDFDYTEMDIFSNEKTEGKIIKKYGFSKAERLHHRSLVEGLFRKGKSFYEFPFRVTWRKLSPEEMTANFRNVVPENIDRLQVMMSVPKKKRKHAVDRVLLRRRMREAYRLNRLGLKEMIEAKREVRTFSVGIIYIHDKNLPYFTIEEKMNIVLKKLTNIISKEG